MEEEKLYIIDFKDPTILEGNKNIPLRSVQSVEIKSDNRSVYIAGKGSNSIFGYTPSSCIYLFDVVENKLKGNTTKKTQSINLYNFRFYNIIRSKNGILFHLNPKSQTRSPFF